MPSSQAQSRMRKASQPLKADETATQSARMLGAELFGTYFLTLVSAGAEVVAKVTGQIHHVDKCFASGLIVLVLIFVVGNISGAHFNPAVTLAFAARGVFNWLKVPFYWAAQFLGAILAGLTLFALFGNVEHLGASVPHVSQMHAFAMEIVLSLLLLSVILVTAKRHAIVGNDAAIAVGFTIVLNNLWASTISGASMNPARSVGPMIVTGELSHAWIYLLAPCVGGLLATALIWLLQGPPNHEEEKVARGEDNGA
jgi:aquaporin Z